MANMWAAKGGMKVGPGWEESELHNNQGFCTSDCEENFNAGSHLVLHSAEGKKGENCVGPLCKLSAASTAKPVIHIFHLLSSFK